MQERLTAMIEVKECCFLNSIIIIIIIILFKSGNKARKYKQETYRQTDRQYK